MNIREQIEHLRLAARYEQNDWYLEPADTLEKLNAVYEAVLPLHVSGSHIYDLDIKLGEAIAAVQESE